MYIYISIYVFFLPGHCKLLPNDNAPSGKKTSLELDPTLTPLKYKCFIDLYGTT